MSIKIKVGTVGQIFWVRRNNTILEETQILNVVGLSLDLIGVAILFFWAPVQPNLEEGIGLGVEDATIVEGKTVSEHNKDKEKQKKKITILSKIGLALILIGFFIQITSNLRQD